ncbi:hypothetical protein BA895_00110 [Humibacillus sp. DSM 29435]|uniref:hypothetical protein n=1 Tax=Humibacillus sp. DSM 29435 TaxID=1869167 RepID=UPI00089351E7|nr:hypothetical protein [Humibacillus sp. DSM 29435]OFE18660.1 hypothetical protein BA895_00110 [Humibacillus sp. DSM 29435]
MSPNVALALITVVVLAVLGLQMLAGRRGPSWTGAIAPTLWVAAVAILLFMGKIETGRPLVVSAAGLLLLLWIWFDGRQTRTRAQAVTVSTLADPSS